MAQARKRLGPFSFQPQGENIMKHRKRVSAVKATHLKKAGRKRGRKGGRKATAVKA